jgi:NADPH-dependent ferric siderophore reductase
MILEEALLKVWHATMVENAPAVELEGQTFPVRTTPKRRLRQVDFVFHHQELRGLQQNPETASRWAQLARRGHKVMQFLSAGRYVANVVDGKVTRYGGKPSNPRPARVRPR